MIGHVFAIPNIIANKLQRGVTKTQEDNIFVLIHIVFKHKEQIV